MLHLLLALASGVTDVSHALNGNVNEMATLVALTRTDRLPRSFKKWGWLKPGDPYRWYYHWVLEDGTDATKIELVPIPGARDERILKDKRPNTAIAVQAVLSLPNVVTAAVVSAKKP